MKAFVFDKTRVITIEDEQVTIKIADQELRFKLAASMDNRAKSEEQRAIDFFKTFVVDWTFKDGDGSKAPIDNAHILNLDPMVVDKITEGVIEANPFLAQVVKEGTSTSISGLSSSKAGE
ncbi:MAG: hypothetical protein PHV74_00100 [Dehalococcoidia bacterium]|nr:hypothetical protein [Dehalococcoidia bacterium]